MNENTYILIRKFTQSQTIFLFRYILISIIYDFFITAIFNLLPVHGNILSLHSFKQLPTETILSIIIRE